MGEFPYIEEGDALLGYRLSRESLDASGHFVSSARSHPVPTAKYWRPQSSMYAEWIFQPGVSWLTLVNYIPVAATVVTTFLSLVLARATLRHVEAADKGLQLAREQFDREWSPELHVRLERV